MTPENTAAPKPKLRGVLHLIGALIALPAGLTLCVEAEERFTWGAIIYSAALFCLLATSATYHVPNWSERPRALLRKLDHAMIFLLIGGSFLPFLMALSDHVLWVIPALMCVGTIVGVLRSLFMEVSSKAVRAASYGSFGLTALFLTPAIYQHLGGGILALVLGGGAVYCLGASAYAFKRPNLLKELFGYHELFHLCVNIGATLHFVAIWRVIVG